MEFLVLGSLEARQSGELIRVRGMRQQKLLALLLLHANRVVPMDVLVDELWEDPPTSARPQVHNAIRDLRRVLSAAHETSLVTMDVGYRLMIPDDAIDARRFVQQVRGAGIAGREGRCADAIRLLQSAVDLWRGDAFAGIHCPSLGSAAVKLHEQRLTALEDLMTLRLRIGETGSLVGELHALLAEYPLRDSLRGSLMLALYRSGRQADALAVYDEGRRFLAEELGLEPSRHLRSLHAEILADSPTARGITPADLAARRTEPRRADSDVRPPAVPAPATVPASPPGNRCNYLPHDLTDFTGRTAESDSLLSAAGQEHDDAPLMIAIDGMGGVGKTTLAVRVAHRVADRYPDGQYFISLHGYSADRPPLPPEQALATLLQASGVVPQALPHSLEERSALWRSRIAGERCLIVLDDAANTAQVTPLLPGTGGALVLVTSRRKLTALDGAMPHPLDVLPPEDAAALFTRIVGEQRAAREPEQVARAVDLCGCLPLAVRIAATRLRGRPAWAVADLVDRLTGAPQRANCLHTADRDLMSMLRTSYQHLDPAQRRFSRLISRHPSPAYDLDHAAAVTGLPVGEVERHFDVLLENNLIREDSPDCFSFHALIRDCTRELRIEGLEAETVETEAA
ncbi:NB-ARC domain-containing protein [Streptomyces sp. RY43-2]|uniref:NB-ARC domain-containing protein n=1 Tax=Streptomyces macrolidinus TaxID=2952607 RepID=A0ABT0ZHI2_9ACTN|nr:AfsR/SARP family transcriptional regulator [Streptomyces macrolidinus]MCN9243043.1 NB-ARC domain-containing protein [Streptomyces macrolidinus]